MGKTLLPFSSLIEQERSRWTPFKKALPKADQALFDRLWDCAKLHIQAGIMVAHPWPFETMVMAIVLEQQKQVERLQRLLDELESRRHA
jgi:3-methyladenine DNA glycosylase/8-oxoguanine DNA glycosylase